MDASGSADPLLTREHVPHGTEGSDPETVSRSLPCTPAELSGTERGTPDRYGIRIGPSGLGRAHIAKPPCGLVFGSADPVAAEAMGLAVLRDARRSLPFTARALERLALGKNQLYWRVHTGPVPENPAIRHAMAIGLGEAGAARNVDGTVPEAYLERLTLLAAGKEV